MKAIADRIRDWTPGWTDHARYFLVSTLHSMMLFSASLFFLYPRPWIRLSILVILILGIISEMYFQECFITMIEQEFSKQSWDDIFDTVFTAWGWSMTRQSKMGFTIGLNVGLLVSFLACLLYETWLWAVGFAGIAVTASLTLALYSKTPHLLPFDLSPLERSRLPRFSPAFARILHLVVA